MEEGSLPSQLAGGTWQGTWHSPYWKVKRPNRSAEERRAQARRAHGRVVQSLLRSFQELGAHRGCATSKLGAALATLLEAPAAQAATSTPAAVQTAGRTQKEAAVQTDTLDKEEEPTFTAKQYEEVAVQTAQTLEEEGVPSAPYPKTRTTLEATAQTDVAEAPTVVLTAVE